MASVKISDLTSTPTVSDADLMEVSSASGGSFVSRKSLLSTVATYIIGKVNAALDATPLSVARGGTGGATQSAGRSGLGAAASGANTDITSITGSAAKLTTARTIASTGDAAFSVSFDGSANVATAMTLTASGVTAGTYGSATAVPVITFDTKGRATSVTTAALGAAAAQTYAEGTFTPTLLMGGSATGATYATQLGKYTRVGRVVTIDITLVATKGSGTGAVSIGGLPFTPGAQDTGFCTGLVRNFTGVGQIIFGIAPSTALISLYSSSAGDYTIVSNTNVSAGNVSIYLTLTYTL